MNQINMRTHLRNILVAIAFTATLPRHASAQKNIRPFFSVPADAPAWVHAMCAPEPNAFTVDSLFRAYYREHAFEKNNFTQYHKKWVNHIRYRTRPDGSIAKKELYPGNGAQAKGGGDPANWTCLGPYDTWNQINNGPQEKVSWQANVYCIAPSASNPDVIYAGSEGSEVFKSVDHGLSWQSVSRGLDIDAPGAIEVDPTDPQHVIFGTDFLYTSIDGGTSWTELDAGTGYIYDIHIDPSDPQIILIAAESGVFRSVDGGAVYTAVLSDQAWDIEAKPDDPAIVYAAVHGTSPDVALFMKSTDHGASFTPRGWLPTPPATSHDGGVRLAVTPADPDRIYAKLCGEWNGTTDDGFVALIRSNDAGENWTNPQGVYGGPYSGVRKNLMSIGEYGGYNQGYYDLALAVSATNADQFFTGGLNVWESQDGGSTFTRRGGYGGDLDWVHPDVQEIRVNGNDLWIATDGGIDWSGDGLVTRESRKNGITGSDYWGFGCGWNEDYFTGGRYHNGNSGMSGFYPSGLALRLGGAEASTGYVNPGEEGRVYLSDIGSKQLPDAFDEEVEDRPFGLTPNESYYASESSTLVFHPHCFGICWLGTDNQLWRSDDAGASFTLVHTFGTTAGYVVTEIDVSHTDASIILVHQRTGSSGKLWKSTDGGANWNELTMPAGSKRVMSIAISATDANTIWAVRSQDAGGKVFKSIDGGANWVNLTTATLSGHYLQDIKEQGGSDGLVFLGTNKTVFYRDNGMSDWAVFAQGLPIECSVQALVPFYRDSKLRLSSYGKGIWETPLPVSGLLYAMPMADKLIATCSSDSFHFDCHSILDHTNATWSWTFMDGSPATANTREVAVVFTTLGDHLVTLTVTDSAGNSSLGAMNVTTTSTSASDISADFETLFPPPDWSSAVETGSGLSWTQTNTAGGYGLSPQCALADNWNNDAQHRWCDLRAAIDLSAADSALITFDLAYSDYGGAYSDTLQVLVSTDCGNTFTLLYAKADAALATAPNNSGALFVPLPGEWRTDTVDISAWLGFPELVVAFRNVGGYGQGLYLDNVNLNDTPLGIMDQHDASFSVFPNPCLPGSTVQVNTDMRGPIDVKLYAASGAEVLRAQVADGDRLRLPQELAAGSYTLHAVGADRIMNARIMVVKGRE